MFDDTDRHDLAIGATLAATSAAATAALLAVAYAIGGALIAGLVVLAVIGGSIAVVVKLRAAPAAVDRPDTVAVEFPQAAEPPKSNPFL